MKQSKQTGAISGALLAVLAILAVILVVAGIAFASYISAYNYGNRMDNQLIAIKDNNRNVYAQGTQKVLEIAQVPAIYTDDLKKLIEADISGRYGKDGSKATMQWFKERNLTLDPSLYTKIQQTVESFRNEFQQNQTRMIDVKRSYMVGQGSFWQGFWLRMAGYPKVNMADFMPVTTDKTEEVFKAGKESAPLKLR
jgi:hypothetical protein